MNLIIRKQAADTIAKTAEWVNNINTEGAGDRWFDRVLAVLQHAAQTGIQHAPCRYDEFAQRGYLCFTYNYKWIVAYQIKGNDFIVYRFVLGSKLM